MEVSASVDAVLIVGGGAIGGTVGAHLARADVPVTIVEVRPDHREAMRKNGLQLTGVSGFVVRPRVIAPDEVEGPIRTALIAVKCQDTDDALALVADHLEVDGVVVSLQNGFEGYRLAERVGNLRAIAALVTLSGYVDAPGSIVHTNVGSLSIGHLDGHRTPTVDRIERLLRAVCPVEVTANIGQGLWSKAAIGAVWFATALVDEDVVTILSEERYLGALGALAAEVAGTAVLEGIECQPIDGFDPMAFVSPADADLQRASWQRHREFWQSIPQTRTGVWRDLAVHHRRTEVKCILSPVTTFAARRQHSVPLLERLIELIESVERGVRPLGWDNLDQLVIEHERTGASEL